LHGHIKHENNGELVMKTPKTVARNSVQGFKRTKVLNSGTKTANQALASSEVGSRAREGLNNKFLSQAPTPKIPKTLLMTAAMALAPTQMGDGTIQQGTINKAKAAAALRAKRRPAK
jgi:hypothetical protein